MKWSFIIQQKLKAALILSLIMLVIILGTMVSKNNIKGIDQSFSSIYKDRLLPATTIIYLTENLYNKRLSLEKYLLSETPVTKRDIQGDLSGYDQNIDSLIKSFEGTYLVEQEAKSLVALKNRIQEYVLLEKMIINLCQAGHLSDGKSLFEGAGANTFQRTILNLNELTAIQSHVGQELITESKGNMASVHNIMAFQISIAVVVGLIILTLIKNSQIISKPKVKKMKEQNFNLN
ncbi:chemoreceptor-like protein with four helix bundle sensory module [Dyadobacter jejuensis]|uniref:Chemoreceptor-like protein with four helix bundle sensory module n=1 Tax=Dyadobacter jejuensis TaxID=1082580 RepID=A0A316AJT3_9BACT|nr:MCP four helix bundle domain-containing protein [Dyadobacter jejuensis]PWJ57120.1 chemoreceptor-like protein with four helix bundle sensory module [Dyadobacter jejuensis]